MLVYNMHVLMRDEKEGQTNNKVKQYNTPKVVTLPKLYNLDRSGSALSVMDIILFPFFEEVWTG